MNQLIFYMAPLKDRRSLKALVPSITIPTQGTEKEETYKRRLSWYALWKENEREVDRKDKR